MSALDIAEIKARLSVPVAWRALGLPGEPKASCKSPLRAERNSSFSIYKDGSLWKDFGTGEGGDVFSFIMKVKGCTFREALELAAQIVGLPSPSKQGARRTRPAQPYPWPKPMAQKPAPSRPEPVRLPSMPEAIRHVWDAGVKELFNNPAACSKIDAWRAWLPGTSRTLAEHGLIGTPSVRGELVTAFAVVDAFGVELGFHGRFEPQNGERARWCYMPSGTPSLPFVIGAGYAKTAKEVFCFEGQWDAICFASAAGWLSHETAWPDNVVLFGVRGTDGWRKLLDTWRAILPETARFTLFPDEDAAGARWTAPNGFSATLQDHGFRVRTVKTGYKDFTDAHRSKTISRTDTESLLARE